MGRARPQCRKPAPLLCQRSCRLTRRMFQPVEKQHSRRSVRQDLALCISVTVSDLKRQLNCCGHTDFLVYYRLWRGELHVVNSMQCILCIHLCIKHNYYCPYGGWDSIVDTATRDGRSGNRILVGERFSCRPFRLWCPPSLLSNEYLDFLGG